MNTVKAVKLSHVTSNHISLALGNHTVTHNLKKIGKCNSTQKKINGSNDHHIIIL